MTLNILGLILSFIGGLMLCIDFWRISSRFQGDTLQLVHKPIRDSRPIRWCGRFGIALITIGFLLQLLAQLSQ
jgi:hypothetical protein